MAGIKENYGRYIDKSFFKRWQSPYPLRRYVHRKKYDSILNYIEPGAKILDIGCGDGTLSILMAQKGAQVTACDISQPNIENAKKLAQQYQINNIKFLMADAESLPFTDNSFDLVVSLFVLSHTDNCDKGLSEIKRITKKRAIIALENPLNLCSVCLIGGDNYWQISKRTIYALSLGLIKILLNWGGEGVRTIYVGKKELRMIWYFPWVMKRKLKQADFKIIHFEANSLCLPYFNFLLPLIKFLDKFKAKPILRNFGCYGNFAIVEK